MIYSKPISSVQFAALRGAAPYSSRLSSRSALYEPLRILLARDDQASAYDDYRSRVVRDNALGLKTASSRVKTWEELRGRYILDRDDSRFAAFWREWQGCRSEEERALTAYVLFALNDRLVFDLGLTLLYPLLRSAPQELRVADVLSFIKLAEARHAEVGTWSANTRLAVAQKYAASVRDFGLARGVVRKTTIRPALYASPTRLLIRGLIMAGYKPIDIVRSNALKLLAIAPNEGITTLETLKARGDLRFKMQADVIDLQLEGSR